MHLFQDLTVANSSAAEPGAIDAYGCRYNEWAQIANGVAVLCPHAKVTSQVTKFVRRGAERVGATSANVAFEPVAFINPDGSWVVAVKVNNSGGSFTVSGVPAGTYARSWSDASGNQTTLSDLTVGSGGVLDGVMLQAGVYTFVRR